MPLCIDPNHHIILAVIKGFDNIRTAVCQDCEKPVDIKDLKWSPVCGHCFCSREAHGKSTYSVCSNCHSCPFYYN